MNYLDQKECKNMETASSIFTQHVIDNTTERDRQVIMKMLGYYMEQIQENLKKGSPEEVLLGVYEAIDEEWQHTADKEAKDRVVCKKGCSFCCHIPVRVMEMEAKVIHWYCKENGIPIDYNRQGSACMFLSGEGSCSIYPVRPLVCRKYFVASDPKFCDTTRYPKGRVINYINYIMEVLTAAIDHFARERGEFKEMIRKYE